MTAECSRTADRAGRAIEIAKSEIVQTAVGSGVLAIVASWQILFCRDGAEIVAFAVVGRRAAAS